MLTVRDKRIFAQRFCSQVNEALGLEPQQSTLLLINTDNNTILLELRGGDPTWLQIAFAEHVNEVGLFIPPFFLPPQATTGAPALPQSTVPPATATPMATTSTQNPASSVDADNDDLTDSESMLLVAGAAVVLVMIAIYAWVKRAHTQGLGALAPVPRPASDAAMAPDTSPDSFDVVVERLMRSKRADTVGSRHLAHWAKMSTVHDEIYGATLSLSNEDLTAEVLTKLRTVDVGSFA